MSPSSPSTNDLPVPSPRVSVFTSYSNSRNDADCMVHGATTRRRSRLGTSGADRSFSIERWKPRTRLPGVPPVPSRGTPGMVTNIHPGLTSKRTPKMGPQLTIHRIGESGDGWKGRVKYWSAHLTHHVSRRQLMNVEYEHRYFTDKLLKRYLPAKT